MAVEKGNEWVSIDPLTLWGKDGRIAVSFRNGYPRFTWFYRTEKGEQAKFFSAPMSGKMFMALASAIRVVARSKVDIKKSLECSNKDFNTKEKILQAVIVVAKKNNKIYFGMKNGSHDVKANVVEFDLGEYGKMFTDDSVDDTGSIEAALAYANYMDYVLLVNSNTMPMNGSVPNTVRNEIDRKKAAAEAVGRTEEKEHTPSVKDEYEEDNDVGF